ncbi:Deoxyribonuclease-2-alpha [Trichinella spiralis]|uniref:Deoxyribonuclease-2-alpha n=1 Tax=Trichinella spiralis TaxID=6334 RepID=A0A0V1ATP0_TRISP|nr:Deoxyribonuclease-2-alpha [Trichinella spiralis]
MLPDKESFASWEHEFPEVLNQTLPDQVMHSIYNTYRAILYKGPAQNNGKLLASDSPNDWANGAAPVTQNNGNSFAVTLKNVVGPHDNVKFLAYNNVPPAVPNVKTNSNSKGVIIISTSPGQNDGAWIVHTVPGFPAARTGYSWPASEIAKGHLLICMTIAETQINAVAASLIQIEPFVYYNDIPETETAGMPDFKKLAEGQIPTTPPFTTRRSIKTAAPAPVDIHIYSKSAKSKYEIYKKVIVKALKKTMKVWSRRDNKLKGDCRVSQRNIRLIKSPAQIGDQATNIEADESNWIVSEPGNIFCFMDKPYSKNQIKEPAMAVCIDKDAIFARFNAIAAQDKKGYKDAVSTNVDITAVLRQTCHMGASPVDQHLRSTEETKPIPLIYDEEASAAATVTSGYFPVFKRVQFARYNHRSKSFPRLPEHRQDLQIPDAFRTTKAGKNLLLWQSALRHIVVFATGNNIGLLGQTKTWGMDDIGTYGPFQALINKAAVLEVDLNPDTIICDFETALIPAIQGYFLNTRVQGCYFRFCQAIHRKVSNQSNVHRAILYKGPTQANGKVLLSTAPGNWADGAAQLTAAAGHSFAGSLTGVVANAQDITFLAYNNVPPAVPNVQTKSNSKVYDAGVIIVSTAARANEGRWIVHTVPGFPAAKTGYNWPAAETAKGHLLICMTIAETQINAIAASLIRAEPFVYYNDIPESETAGMGDFKKLAEGQTATLPPFTIKQSIKITAAAPIDVHIYSKSAKSRYEFYKKVILKKLKKTIKVWSRRDNKLKGDCRVIERNVRLIKSPAQIGDHATNIEADQSNWIVSEPGNIFCFTDKPYAVTILKKSQAAEPAMAVCIDQNAIFARFDAIAAQKLLPNKTPNAKTEVVQEMPIGPAQNTGKLLASDVPGNWADGARDVTQAAGHSFGVILTDVVGNNVNVKFLAYNNVPPGIPNVKTKSNGKVGVIMISTAVGVNDGAWIVHTVPGFPAAKTGYSWPAAEIARGHLLICMTIAETQINAIAASLFRAEPFVYYNDIPETETAGMPDFKKLAEGQIPTTPPFTISRSIKLTGAGAVSVQIFSKSAKSRYEMYRKVILRGLKKTIKVWSRRDNKLKGDCRVLERNIRLIKSPAQIGDHATNIEADESNWIVSEPGNIFCFMDKPYAVTIQKKSQATEPALAACFDQAAIFARFNTIAAQVENCPQTTKNNTICQNTYRVILYKGPAQNTGKLLASDVPGNWDDGARDVAQVNGHSFAATLTDVVGNNNNDVKFLAYNNVPPGIPNVKTKSNGKGIIIIRTTVGQNDGAWIVHTVPGFPKARTGYSWPAAEIAKGHLLICMTIAKTQINAIAASLFHAEPFVYYNDIPETETAGMPDFKKLAEGQIPTTPPFTINRSIKLTGAGAVPVHIYSNKTKSRYGIIIIRTTVGQNDGAWIVHTVPGFPKARTGYSWPAAEIAKGHLLICMTIAKTQINAIAASLFRAEPFVYYNDIPETETVGMPDFKKLAEGQIPTTSPFTISRSIKLTGAGAVSVQIFSKSAKSRYEMYRKVILRGLKKTIKVWSRRDNKLKGDCRVLQRNIRLIKSPAQIGDHATNIEADESNWIVSEPGNIFCFMDKPYAVTILKKSQATEPALAACFDQAAIFARFNTIAAQFLCFCYYQISQIRKIRDAKIQMVQETQIGPSQDRGKFLASDAPDNWVNGAAAVTDRAGHSFAVTLNDVVGNNADVKFFAYNNIPPGIPNVKTKSNGKGVIMISTAVGVNDGAWIVHTVPGFPAAKTGYSWPAAEIAKGHLLICMTIAETQINAIAASLFRAEPFVYYNDIPETETAGMPDFKKLAEGQIPTTPPFTISRSIKLTGAGAVSVQIFSKSAKSRYEMYRKVILRGLKKTIKVWSRRDNKLKGDCRVLERNIRLIKSPAQIGDHATNIEADESNWIVSEPGNIFCFMDKPYAVTILKKSQATEPALAACFDQAAIFARFNTIAAQVENCPQKVKRQNLRWQLVLTKLQFLLDLILLLLKAILYKGPRQDRGKFLASNAPDNWVDGAAVVTDAAGHSFAGALNGVVGNNANVKFLAYNNVPPGIPNVKTKSNGKGVIMISTAVGANDGAWIVHTVPGFPKARTGYSWPAAEIAKGHLLICMTIAETQINAIAASLFRAQPFVYYNDIPETETVGMPDFKKLAEGQIPTTPPFTISQTIKLTGAGAVPVHIYSKSAKSRYEFYKKVILKKLKKTIKVWSRRDNKLKGDCRVLQRNIRLIKSPAQIGDHATNIEADESNWIVSEPGNIFCFMDKPYAVTIQKKSQATEPALAACFDQAAIFARFNTIAAQTLDYPQLLRNAGTLLYCAINDSPLIIYYVKYSYRAAQLLKLCMSEMLILCLGNATHFIRTKYFLYFLWKVRAVLYKGPAQNNGKLLASDSPNDWANGAAVVTQPNGHSFAAALTNVVGPHANVKFLAYNNVPPAVPNVKTKSNSKGVIIINTTPGQNDGAWIVHTVPGFPAARTGYSWPASEIAKGHLLICMTIAETQINAVAASLIQIEPFIYYNDIPETETAGMPDFKKLAEGQIPVSPPFTTRRSIKTAAPAPVDVHIYSKSAKSKYEIYKKVIVKALKKTIKVWSRRDNKLKGDCRVLERNIRLINSPAQIGDHPTNIEADESNWIVSEPGNIFCFMDKPYAVTILKLLNLQWVFVLTRMQFLLDLMPLLLKLRTAHDDRQIKYYEMNCLRKVFEIS